MAAVTLLLIPFEFDFLVVIDVFFMVVVCALTVVAAMILKRRIPEKDIPFKIPGGKASHTLLSVIVITICVLSTLLNGTDWFLGGLLWILIVPVLYIFCKRKYGGLTMKDPALYPVDPRTGLGFGDLKKIGYFYIGLGIFALIGRLFLFWYESDWGPEYYIEEYESGLFSNFDLMLTIIVITGVVTICAGIIFYLFGKKIESSDKQI